MSANESLDQPNADHQPYHCVESEIPRDLAPGGQDHGGAKSLGHLYDLTPVPY